jgi:RNA polymerase sigma-70 factor (ECF subfamily)
MDATAIEDALRRAREAWPTVTPLAAAVFGAWLADRLPHDSDLARAPTNDLYLACACAQGDAAAIAAFESGYLREVAIAAAKLRAAPEIADEARQVVRELLFVARPERPAAIASYAGRGDLRGWVRVVAMREVLRLCQRDRREIATDDDALLDALSPASDPELEQLKERYRQAFAEAFAEAVRGLPARERKLLRLSVVDGLGVEAIGKRFEVHHATAARWLVRAREMLLEGTRTRLAGDLGLTADEVDSVIRLVRSRVEVSIVRLLKG